MRETAARTDGRTDGDGYRLPYWPINSSSLDHSLLYYLQHPTKNFFSFSAREYSTGGLMWIVLWEAAQVGHSATRWCSPDWPLSSGHELRLTQELASPYPTWASHISFHNTHTFRSTIWRLPLIFTGASWAENLWLTARWRGNMQQCFDTFRSLPVWFLFLFFFLPAHFF